MSKYNVRRKAQLGLDIREGGIAIPIANNMWYIHGRKHEYGGVTMGPNNKNGVEVEGGEVVEMIDSNHPSVGRQFAAGGQSQTMRVFSSVPLLRGVSPAQLVIEGANPNKVFAAQEEFKDRNRINDDGTRYEVGGEKIYTPSKSIQRQIQETGKITIGGAPTIGGLRTRAYMYGLKQAIKYPAKVSNVIRNIGGAIKKSLINKSFSYKPDFVPMKTWKYATGTVLNQQVTGNKGSAWVRTGKLINDAINNEEKEMKAGGIYIKPSKRGTFTAAATKHGMGVQEFANKVLANKEDYSPAMVKKANFARNANRWKKEYGGDDTKTAALKRIRNKFTISGDYSGGMFGGAGAGSVIMAQPEYITDTITKKYLVPVTQNFNDAFGDAVNAGLDKFMFDNKWYNTEKGNNPNNNAAGAARTQTVYLPVEHKEVRRRKKEFGGSMIYTINGNVKNGLNLRPKAQYGLASKYLKKKNKTTQKPVETKQKEESKILDIRNTAGYKVKQAAENSWVKYPVEVASYLLTGATAKGMQTGAKIASKAVNKIDDILGKPRQEYLSRNISDKTINYSASSKNSVGSTYKATSKDLNRAKKEVQNRPTINDLAEARSTVGNVPQHTTISYNSSPQNPVSTINYFDVKNTKLPNIERFGRKQMDAKTSRELDKVYRKAVGNKEPKSGFGRVPQQTTIEYTPKGESITAYDASAEFHKRISDMLYNSLVKKYGKKGVDKAMKAEHISKYEYGGRIKAKNGKFLKYKNGIFTDPETGEEFEVDPEVFKMYGNTKESGVIPTDDYTKGTFNARPQYYAKKQLPIAGSKSIAEKAGLARSGWSYGENPTVDYVPSINLTVPENYSKGVASSTPRGRGTKTSTSKSKSASKPSTKGTDVKYGTPLKEKKESLYMTGIKNNSITPLRAGMEKIKSPSSTGGGTQSKDGRWIGQYKTTNVGDWIGLGSNLAGSVASYFMTKNAINKMPEPIKPVMAQAAKLKTRYNVEPQLTELREAEQMNRAAVRRNTQSSNTSLAREQRLMNEARGARNTLYGQKENIETQLINQDRLNRQDVFNRNIAAFNDWLDKTYIAKTNKLLEKQKNMMSLINGIPSAVNHTLGVIESRRNTNNTLRAIAAANPNVDARQIGGFDYYEGIGPDGTHKALYDKHQRFVRYI